MMRDTLKDWLPITKRNRVALGFAFAALLMFVSWNFLPINYLYNSSSYMAAAVHFWPLALLPDTYFAVFRSPRIDGFLAMAAYLSLILSGLIVLTILPLWKMFHASVFVRIPLAVINLAGGSVIYYFICRYGGVSDSSMWSVILMLMGLSMFALSASLFIFKNELGLQHELEVEKTMEDGDSQ
jgi:ABC-type glycerol-3-phosphate transport system permease component